MSTRQEEVILNTSHRMGTILRETVIKKENPLIRFKTADMVANEINQMFGIELLTGTRLLNDVKKGRVGEPPIKKGREPTIPEEEMKDLAELFFTMVAIEQTNADINRLNRPEESSLLDQIVNERQRDRNQPEISAISLYKRIEKENYCRLDVDIVDKRDAIRVAWLTYQKLLKNHINFERLAVERGHARMPRGERERHQKGHVVFHDPYAERYTTFDEAKITLDGKDEDGGGRPVVPHTSREVSESGVNTEHSGNVSTIMMATIGDEAAPFMVVYPTRAKETADYKIPATHCVMSDWSLPNSFHEHTWGSRETPEESLHRNTEEQTQSNMVMVQRGHRRRYQEKGLKRLSLAIKSLPREIELSNAEEDGGSGIFQWSRI